MKKKEIKLVTENERKEIQLSMLREIDSICRENGIKYSLAYGTLLGAIRHEGFIPWDDDVDIMMPYSDMLKFIKLIQLSDLIEYHDATINKDFPWFFSRLAHKKTYSKEGLSVFGYGVNIDLYPTIGLPEDEFKIEAFLKKGTRLNNFNNEFIKWRSRIIRRFPVHNIPFFNKCVLKLRRHAFQYASLENIFFGTGGSFRMINVWDFNPYEKLIEAKFENNYFLISSNYDRLLKKIYGDYMQLPPEEERIPYHRGTYYWK